MQKSLVKQLAIRPGRQETAARSLVIAKQLDIPRSLQTALHSHSAKSPEDGGISRWLTPAKWRGILKLLGYAIASALSTTAFAVGLGGINVGSGLGQQLKAEIELVAVSKTEKASLVARLASPEAYKEAGLEYPYGNKFKFQIESRANGEPYLKVSSDQPISDPFVIMMVELTWSSGKLLREYTFLLDPPGYVPEQPAQATVQAVAPVIQPAMPAGTSVAPGGQAVPMEQPSSRETAATTPVGQAAPTETGVAPAGQPSQATPAASAVQAAPAAAGLPEFDEFFAIKRGDTMREVAEHYRLADVSLDRMLVALYRVNADRFDGKNMNRIRAGKVLRLPHRDEVEAVSQPDALREIRAQTADWNVYRQKLASAAAIRSQTQEAQQVATGKISSSVADMAPVAKEAAKEVLKLSKGEAPGDGTTAGLAGKPESVQDKINAAQEDTIAKSKALKEDQARVAMLEKNIQDMQRLAALKSEAAAQAQSSKAASSAVVVASGLAAASAEKQPTPKPAPAPAPKPVPKPVPKPAPKPKVAEPEPLLDQILGEPLYLAGGALLLFGLGGLGYMFYRRKNKPDNENIGEVSEVAGSTTGSVATTGRIAAPVVSSPDTGDFTRMGATDEAAPPSDNIDPISEADLFLNFGRDAQAEEILKEALQSTPDDHRIHLKLLGIYANRVDTNSFSAIARQLRDSGDANAWQQAVAMGLKLEPNNPLYGGSGTVEDTGSATAQAAAFDATQLFADNATAAQPTVLDFDIDLGTLSGKETPSPEQDFLGGTDQNAVMTFDVSAGGQAPEMDFNVAAGQGEGGQTEAALPDTGDMIFDVTAVTPAPVEQPAVAKPEADSGGMEFTIDFPLESAAPKAEPEAQPAGTGLAGISLNFDDAIISGEPAPAGKNEHWQEIATKLDLAKAYQEMGDASGAREILEEVMRDGDAGQREAAQTLINQLG